MTTTRQAAEHEPIARVVPMLQVPHLDRDFDYLVSAEHSDDAQPGVRVRVRFHGRLVDAFILERRSDTDHV
ncbi:MAG TPA: primosome assembly protein PriA, partial [Mycobacterium sp.]